MCTKCVDECPTGAIIKVNFPVKKAQPAKSVETVAQPAAASVNEETKVEEKK